MDLFMCKCSFIEILHGCSNIYIYPFSRSFHTKWFRNEEHAFFIEDLQVK